MSREGCEDGEEGFFNMGSTESQCHQSNSGIFDLNHFNKEWRTVASAPLDLIC